MRWPLMLTSVAEVQVAGLTALIETKDGTISAIRKSRDLFEQSAKFQKARADNLRVLLDDAHALLAKAYVRGPGGRFQPAPLPTPPETNA